MVIVKHVLHCDNGIMRNAQIYLRRIGALFHLRRGNKYICNDIKIKITRIIKLYAADR